MANKHETLTALFDDIADAIREKTEDTAKIVADTFPDAIRNIQTKGYPIAGAVVTLGSSLTYNGQEQTQTITKVMLEGTELRLGTDYEIHNNTATKAGAYTLTVNGIGRYEGIISVAWSIDRAVISALPRQSNSLTYTGSSQSPTWTGYDPEKMVLGGTKSSISGGTFTATFTPTENYKWWDGSITAKSVQWTISRLSGSISVSPSSLSIEGASGKTAAATVTTSNSGTISASGGSSSIATASVSGKTVTVTARGTGSTSFTITAAADSSHNSASCTLRVSVSTASTTLNSNSWATIKSVSDAGQGSNYWSEGDAKTITVNGTVGAEKISSLSVQVFILGFNHNSSREGSKRIHFGLGKISGKLAALVDSSYDGTTATSGKFVMNTSGTNAGGWSSSHMRSTVLGSSSSPTSPKSNTLLAALPSDLKSVMKSVTKYTDNKGGGTSTASAVTSTTDYLWLLAEYEVFGTCENANDAERNYQQQYAYFRSGNNKVAYKHNATSAACWWQLRSPYYYSSNSFCSVHTSGSYTNYIAYCSGGLVAAFAV